MKKQAFGIGLILFGIILAIIEYNEGIWIPVINNLPWSLLALISGVAGLIVVAKAEESK